ncbi:MAG: DEAD/DEAH box helicase, partial [Streptosporangiaceae bacterium]
MRPSLAAEELQRNLTHYLTTTFGLSEENVRSGLESFLSDPERGVFRGPYLRIRTPFRTETDTAWQAGLGWWPQGFVPFRHQAESFARLSTLTGPAEPTLITTGTGSGKTESFLIPILDHCRRTRLQARPGVKAVLLYPMNALASDQAGRINDHLADARLHGVTAGLYIGDISETGYAHVMTDRGEIRRSRPDLLITNYKMLDLLLQRSEDLALWEGSDLAFVVVDEFHTYDGAQGTDVAMLLRRLASATGNSRPGRPLGDICPVATSATLGQGGVAEGGADILEVAEHVFGTPFGADSVVGEDRLRIEEFIEEVDYDLPMPSPRELAALPDPERFPDAMALIAQAVTGRMDLDPIALGDVLQQHVLTRAVINILDGKPKTAPEILEWVPRQGAFNWGRALPTLPEEAATALARFVALLSLARDAAGRPFVNVETHLWVRAVQRLLREVSKEPAFRWDRDPDQEAGSSGRAWLPAVSCRNCGRSGWAAFSPAKDPHELKSQSDQIYRAKFTAPKRVRALIRATDDELKAARGRAPGTGANVLLLDEGDCTLKPVGAADVRDTVPVWVDLLTDRAAEDDRCPVCDVDQGIRFVGHSLAAIASVAVTQLFTGNHLPAGQKKTLLFNDSVQDAAHRAGFVANRAHQFSLRSLLVSGLTSDTRLDVLIGDLVKKANDPEVLSAVVP